MLLLPLLLLSLQKLDEEQERLRRPTENGRYHDSECLSFIGCFRRPLSVDVWLGVWENQNTWPSKWLGMDGM